MSITAADFEALQPGVNQLTSQTGQRKLQQQKADLESKAQAEQIERAKGLQDYLGKMAPGKKFNTKVGNVDISQGESLPPIGAELKREAMQTGQENKYSKSLEKYSDVNGALQDLERVTNRDGKGGVLTNPKASLVSSGKVISALPDSALGLAELTHMAPPGTAEERKALARMKLSLGHAMTGARMNPTMQKMIQDSLGGIASGDPALMTKGIRGAAGIIGSQVNTVQSGFDQKTRDTVHERLGSDPMDFYKSIVKDPPAGAKAPPSVGGTFNPDDFLKGQ